MHTLLLDQTQWDLVLDVFGNIAMAQEPYSQAQDAASAIRLFEGELWYNTSKGVPYWTQILGRVPNAAIMRTKFNQAALTVPGVAQAETFLTGFKGRMVTGQVQITSDSGQQSVAKF